MNIRRLLRGGIAWKHLCFLGVLSLAWVACQQKECERDGDCARPFLCRDGRCAPICSRDQDCPSPKICSKNFQCVYATNTEPPDSATEPAPPDTTLPECGITSPRRGERRTQVSVQCGTQTSDVSFSNEWLDPCRRCREKQLCKDSSCWSLGSIPEHPAASCKALLQDPDGQSSGVYWLKAPKGKTDKRPFRAYCDQSTAGGGWTLCLNVRYTKEAVAKGLFADKRNPRYPPIQKPLEKGRPPTKDATPHTDPFGDYDFCPTRTSEIPFTEIRFALANAPGLRYTYGIVDFKLSNTKPHEQNSDTEHYVGVTADDSTWLPNKTSIPLDGIVKLKAQPPPKTIHYWRANQLNNPALHSVFRGFAALPQQAPSQTGTVWIGAGCHLIHCKAPTPENYQDRFREVDESLTLQAAYIRWIPARNPEDTTKVLLIQGFRVQVYYR